MGLSKNVFYSKYLLLFAILMEEIMINYSILTCSAFPNKQCFVRFPIASWRQWGSITRLYVFRQRHDEADCSTNWIYIHICIIYTVYIYIGNMLHMLHMLHHHAHLPSLCSISSFEILKPWFEHVYSLKIYQWQSTYAYMYIYIYILIYIYI